jgi:hypothetical protein
MIKPVPRLIEPANKYLPMNFLLEYLLSIFAFSLSNP